MVFIEISVFLKTPMETLILSHDQQPDVVAGENDNEDDRKW